MSNTFILQNSIFPDPKICEVKEMFFRSDSYFDPSGNCLVAPRPTHIDFHTYFNLIPISHYKEYLGLTNIDVACEFKGRAEFLLFANVIGYSEPQQIATIILESQDLESKLIIFNDLDISNISGYMYFAVNTHTPDFIMRNFSIECKSTREPAKVGIVSCTFKREKDILRTVECIKNEMPKDIYTFENTKIYIIDNDEKRNLQIEETDKIAHLSNKNLGGAGGFTRGILEVIKADLDYVLLCDDDILIFGEIFRRTIVALSLLINPKMGLHGAMLELENKHILHEAGEYFDINKRHHVNPHYGKNMLDFGRLKEITLESFGTSKSSNMYGWWFTAFPTSIFKDIGLPLPVFVAGDDLDFSLRAYANGYTSFISPSISVWHPSHETQHTPLKNYFVTRNRLAYFPLHTSKEKTKKLLMSIIDGTYYLLLTKRYATAEGNILALEDFLRKGEWYEEDLTDWVKRFKYFSQDRTQSLYQSKWTVPTVHSHPTKAQDNFKNKLLSKLTFNGHIFPSKFHKEVDSPASQYHVCIPYGVNSYNKEITKMTFRASSVLFFDPHFSVGFRVKHNSKKFWILTARLAKVALEANLKFDELYDSYQEKGREVTTFEWWKKRLDLDI